MNEYIHEIFDSLSVGVVVLDKERRIVDANRRFCEWFAPRSNAPEIVEDAASKLETLVDSLRGAPFYQAVRNPMIIDGDYCPLSFFDVQREQEKQRLLAVEKRREARAQAAKTRSKPQTPKEIEAEKAVLRAEKEREERWKNEKRTSTLSTLEVKFQDKGVEYFELIVSKYKYQKANAAFLLELRKVPKKRDREEALLALRKAGEELATKSENSLSSSPDERKAMLQELIKKHMLDILRFDVFEIRTLEDKKALAPFLSVGMRPEVTDRQLTASPDGQGITGYVAFSGEPYFCEDTGNDFLYIEGAVDRARCSITVPLLYHGRVVGVCNVESATPDAFTRADLDFLQLYANDLARAVQTLKLISAESEHTKRFCGEQIRDQFYADVDDVCEHAFLTFDKATQLKAQGKLDSDFVEQIRQATRSVWALRAKIGDVKKDYLNPKTPPSESEAQRQTRSTLRGRRVLIVNPNRVEARQIGEVFESFDCRVDVAFSTKTARQLLQSRQFDLVVCDLFPDGRYFDEIDPDARRNKFDVSPYHIHKKHYEIPVEGDKIDAKTRREILRQIREERRLDAYFLRLEIEKLGLDPPPVYALSTSSQEHDSTHVITDLNEFNEARGESRAIAFAASAFSFVVPQDGDRKLAREKQLKKISITAQQLANALEARDSNRAAEDEQ